MNTRCFRINDKEFVFNFQLFRKVFNEYRKNKNIKAGELEWIIANETKLTPEAIHNWRFTKNGPSNLDTVKLIAKAMEIDDWKLFIKDKSEKQNMSGLSERQVAAVKRIYDSIIDFLHYFNDTDGITGNLWYELQRHGVEEKDVEDTLYEIAENRVIKLQHVFDKEYFDLKNTDIYAELEKYVYEDIYDIYNEKLGYAYRFEAGVEKIDGTRDTVTTEEDYIKYLNLINGIIDKYI